MEQTEKAVFENLRVYQQTLKFIKIVYEVTAKFPKEERYNLTSQFNRAAVSIALNIAESQGKQTSAEKRNFLVIARGSAFELVALSEVSFQLKLIDQKQKSLLRAEIFSLIKQLNQFIKYHS